VQMFQLGAGQVPDPGMSFYITPASSAIEGFLRVRPPMGARPLRHRGNPRRTWRQPHQLQPGDQCSLQPPSRRTRTGSSGRLRQHAPPATPTPSSSAGPSIGRRPAKVAQAIIDFRPTSLARPEAAHTRQQPPTRRSAPRGVSAWPHSNAQRDLAYSTERRRYVPGGPRLIDHNFQRRPVRLFFFRHRRGFFGSRSSWLEKGGGRQPMRREGCHRHDMALIGQR